MTDPIIIIGMHRSGTTMITDYLQQLGLHLGWVLQENAEALFFVERNERLLNICGGDWEHPGVIENLLGHELMRSGAAKLLRKDIDSAKFFSFLGPDHRAAKGNLDRLNTPWGWKDPRNSFLLPLWLDLFPNAKIVHIHRHPMDVAMSLEARGTRQIERQGAKLQGRKQDVPVGTANRSLRRDSKMLYFYRKLGGLRSRVSAMRQFEAVRVPSTTSLEAGLKLWGEYVGRCLEHTDASPDRSITLSYEEFLEDPVERLRNLSEFAELTYDEHLAGKMCMNIDASRRYAFQRNESAQSLFARFADDPITVRLGYDRVR